MEKIKCSKCAKIIEGYNNNQIEHLMQQHMLKHERKERNDKKQIIVYAYVCGDPLHVGHLLHLKNCYAMGNKLIIGVLTDSAIRERKPSPKYPFEERIKAIELLRIINGWKMEVVPQETYSPLPNVKRLKPNILAESTSHRSEDIKEAKKVMAKIGGEVKILPYYEEQSSTRIKEKDEQWKKTKQ
jgi:cytidyltransferase-like protein